VAYFTAVLARSGSRWRARDVELDEAGTLEDLSNVLRSVAVDDQPVIGLLEHEDEWFAVFRVDGDDDARLFVSDLPAASISGYAELVASAADLAPDDDDVPAVPAPAPSRDEEDEESGAVTTPSPPAWAGEPDLLEDLGVTGPTLRRLVEEHDEDPAAVLSDLAERIGFSELLEALR
jgi:putative tRNA adenosine deaminase-associated protein